MFSMGNDPTSQVGARRRLVRDAAQGQNAFCLALLFFRIAGGTYEIAGLGIRT